MRGNCTALMSQPKFLGTGPEDKDIVGTSSIAKQSMGHGPPKTRTWQIGPLFTFVEAEKLLDVQGFVQCSDSWSRLWTA